MVAVAMFCDFCIDRPKLSNLFEVTGEQPHSHDFDYDGSIFRICPDCLTVDTLSLREDRILINERKKYNSLYSGRDKKAVVYRLCQLLKIEGEKRKITIKNIMDDIRPLSDTECFEKISGELNISSIKVEILFYNVKRYREYR